MIRLCYLILTLLSGSFYVYSQTKKESKKARKDSVKQYKIDNGKFVILPLIVPAYTPKLDGQYNRFYRVIS